MDNCPQGLTADGQYWVNRLLWTWGMYFEPSFTIPAMDNVISEWMPMFTFVFCLLNEYSSLSRRKRRAAWTGFNSWCCLVRTLSLSSFNSNFYLFLSFSAKSQGSVWKHKAGKKVKSENTYVDQGQQLEFHPDTKIMYLREFPGGKNRIDKSKCRYLQMTVRIWKLKYKPEKKRQWIGVMDNMADG